MSDGSSSFFFLLSITSPPSVPKPQPLIMHMDGPFPPKKAKRPVDAPLSPRPIFLLIYWSGLVTSMA